MSRITPLEDILGLDEESLRTCISDSRDLIDLKSIVADVQRIFGGDDNKASLWFRTKNPLLGDVEPRDMILHGRKRRLAIFVEEAIASESRNHEN